MHGDRLVGVVVGAAAFLAGLGIIHQKAIRPAARFLKEIATFLHDWNGEPADEKRGVEEKHGVIKRLTTIEHEVRTNGGGSLKDAVNVIATRQGEIREELRTHFREADQRDQRIERLEVAKSHYRTQAEVAHAVLHEVGVEKDLPMPPLDLIESGEDDMSL